MKQPKILDRVWPDLAHQAERAIKNTAGDRAINAREAKCASADEG